MEGTNKNVLDTLQQSLHQKSCDLAQAKAELNAAEKREREALQQLATLNLPVNQDRLGALQAGSIRAIKTHDFQEEETLQKITLSDIFSEYQLTKGQTELVAKLELFLENPKEYVFLLKGYAGTGKTFITKGLTEYFQIIGRICILAAPTGKAAKVIANKTNCEARTLHKTIYSFKDILEYHDEGIQGTETYKYYAELLPNSYSSDTVYIVDEASMVSDKHNEGEFFRFGSGYLLTDFLKFVNLDHNDHRKKVIFIGDDAQLPPVDMRVSPALSSHYLKTKFDLDTTIHELTDVVRQKLESGVMHNATKLRKALDTTTFNELVIDSNYPDVELLELDSSNKCNRLPCVDLERCPPT